MSKLTGEFEQDPAVEDMGRTFRAERINCLIREWKITKVRDIFNEAYPRDCLITGANQENG